MGTPILPSTVDREITVIAAGLHSVSDMFEGYDDYRSPDIPRLKGTTLRRERILSIRESKAIIGFLSKHYPDVARAVEFAALTGLRRSEIAAVRKTDYDPDANSLQVYRSKTGETSHLWPLTPRMVELLTDDFYPNGEFVFSVSGKPLAMTYKALRAAGKHAGIPYGQYTPGGWVMHDLRHTFVTALQQGGADLATIKAFSGHSDSTLVLRYSHARPDSRKAAMDVIGQREVLINGNGKKADTGGNHTLAELFEDVRGGKIELEEFIKRVARSQ